MTHLRRSTSPEWWPVERKGLPWSIKPSPGPHPAYSSIPLAVLLRDVFHYARTLKEARLIIGKGYVKVDGKVRRDYKYPVGLMDVVELTPISEYYRIIPDSINFLKPIRIDKAEASVKVCRIEDKTMVKEGRIQLNLHDGRNIIVEQDEGKKYETLGSVVINLEDGKLMDYYPMQPNQYVIAFSGINVGKHGTLVNWVKSFRKRDAIATVKAKEGEFKTILDYLLVIGKESPVVKVTE
ncbi:30S ribosomal protein S4e [Caldivirga sp.]|uniref:30S ribosomal protein S4e n=1 Tax=Caldivirga sp. TaxID=2080243 RepID=UPI003D0F974B